MIAAYHATLDLVRRAGALDLLAVQDDLRIDYVDDEGFTALDCPPLPAPLPPALSACSACACPGACAARPCASAWPCGSGGRPSGITLAEYFARTGQSALTRRLLWDPLAIAILNETPERAAAVLFYNVYREAFLRTSRPRASSSCGAGTACSTNGSAATSRAAGATPPSRPGRGDRGGGRRVRGVRYAQRAETRDEIRRGRRGGERLGAGGRGGGRPCPGTSCPASCPRPWRTQPPFAALARPGRLAHRLRRDVAGPRGGGPADGRPARLRGGVGLRQGPALRPRGTRRSTSRSS